jgi:hypothetical protein
MQLCFFKLSSFQTFKLSSKSSSFQAFKLSKFQQFATDRNDNFNQINIRTMATPDIRSHLIDSARCSVNNAGTMFLIVEKMIRTVTEERSSLDAVDSAIEIARLTRLLNVLQTRCVDWRRLLDTLRAELDKHDLPEYFRLLNDNVEFLMANNTIRAQIRDGTLYMIRLDGGVVFEQNDASSLLDQYPLVEQLSEHVKCDSVPVYTAFDEYGRLVPSAERRLVLRYLTLPEMRQYCANHSVLVPLHLRAADDVFSVPAPYDRDVRRRFV